MKETISRPKGSKGGHLDPAVPTQAELDIMREKAEALGRTGERLGRCLRRLKVLEEKIKGLEIEGKEAKEVNELIYEFNQMREKAEKHLHHLIIHREAIGFRRHHNVERIYRIPAKKRSLQEEDVREDHHP
ncbi:MAG: hypothetical protein JSW32_05185 [Deltaproteobacteria bacterium]|nr:MAG: hypothetical protein JSW32_05185 [Deltaproteobacteria bacterium]